MEERRTTTRRPGVLSSTPTQNQERRPSTTRPSVTTSEIKKPSTARPVTASIQQEERKVATVRPVAQRPTASRPTVETQAERPVVHEQSERPAVSQRPSVNSTTSRMQDGDIRIVRSGESVEDKIARAMAEKHYVPQPIQSRPTISRETSEQERLEDDIKNIPLDELINAPETPQERPLGQEEMRMPRVAPARVEEAIEERIITPEEIRNVVEDDKEMFESQSDEGELPKESEDERKAKGLFKGRKRGDKDEQKDDGKDSKKHGFIKWLISLAILIGIFGGLRVSGVFASEIVVGTSMEPNYHTNDMTISSNLKDISRYDVVVATSPTGTEVIKRVIGMPGDTITYKNRHIYINGVLSDETFINDGEEIELNMSGKLELGDNEYFLAGDNRENSSDSRIYGAVSGDSIHGVVLVKVPTSFKF